MIKTVDINDGILCKAKSLYSPFMTKILSVFKNERTIYDVLLYCQTDGDANVTAIILNSSSNFTVFAKEDCCIEEISDFLEVSHFYSVLSNVRLPLDSLEKSGKVMKHSSFSGETTARLLDDGEMKNVHALLKNCFDNIPDFPCWYADMSHRMRHGGAFAVGEISDGKLVSCAVCPYINENSAIINGVCTDGDFRNSGYAGSCVKKAVEVLADKNIGIVYVLCRDELKSFYFNNGFQEDGVWYEYIRQIQY